MVELRSAAAQLIENPLVPTPPLEGVVARARRYRAARLRKQMGASALVLALMVTAAVKAGFGGDGANSLRMVGEPASDYSSGGVHIDTSSTTLPGQLVPPDVLRQLGTEDWMADYRNRYGGTCPTSVDPILPTIKVLADDVDSLGLGEVSPFLKAQQQFAMYNAVGGICGRALELVKGSLKLAEGRNDLVAVLGTPLDDNLEAGITGGLVERLRIPVVGGDGLSAAQHESPLVYPVGTSAVALTRTAVEDARARGADSFAIVYDSSSSFSREAAEAFSDFVPQAGGYVKDVVDVGDDGTMLPIASERFHRACGDGECDFVFLALRPADADRWMQTRPAPAKVETAALPTLLTGGFPESCVRTSNDRCHGIVAWTGFIPYFESNDLQIQALLTGKLDVSRAKGGALLDGTALGAEVLREALLRVGPMATRARLRDALDAGGFAPYGYAHEVRLQWGARLPRVGNPVSRRWQLEVDDMVRWSNKVKAQYRGSAERDVDGAAQWPSELDAWIHQVPAWGEQAMSYARRADVVVATWVEELRQWAKHVAERPWATDATEWAEESVPRPGGSVLPSRLPLLPHGPPPPEPPPQTSPPTPHLPGGVEPPPLPQKWWHPTGTGFRGDPGE